MLAPGASFYSEHDRVLVIGAHDNDFYTTRLTLNGSEEFRSMEFRRGVKYRLRVINIGPNLEVNVQLSAAGRPVTWRAIAKDGADLPPRLATVQDASLHIVSGEVYDFEFQPDAAGEMQFQVENNLNKANSVGKVFVQ